ncbi:MAG: glucosidase [Chitinophagaceae bacterium]
MSIEQERLAEHYKKTTNWLKWGPYLSERQWGTVREDYSADGDAWNFITHDMARSKTYRWGEDGLAGFCDDHQLLNLGLALWNEQDAILKERLFGLTNGEGNHGEDVKELYYYLDNTPTHSYCKMLYKYPQQAYPYERLLKENQSRDKFQPEFELIDTGLFDDNRYFDVFIEYVKNTEDDLLVRYTIHNRGKQEAPLHVLPQLWYSNTWRDLPQTEIPAMTYLGANEIVVQHKSLGEYFCYFDGTPEFLFTNNETNNERLYQCANNSPYVKDAFHSRVIDHAKNAVNEQQEGTKAAAWYSFNIPSLDSVQLSVRLTSKKIADPFNDFKKIIDTRKQEADAFYESLPSYNGNEDEKNVQRQAWAGMLWSKQYYNYNVYRWLKGDPGESPPPEGHSHSRNHKWKHLIAAHIISMPDKWEYPWFAAWDLAFHCIALATIDPDFAKNQLDLLVRANYMHPSGQLPAYEWDFDDVNPPVHALAAWKIFNIDKSLKSRADYRFLEKIFQKLLINFTWWVNRKDSEGNNIFEGGFLGLDNIGVFNRSQPVPGGGHLEQADATSWMATYALNMMQIAMELSLYNQVYETMAVKFSEHFMYIAGSITNMGEDSFGLWDDVDGFYYDVIRKPNGQWDRLRLRTLVGLIPMFASIVFDESKWSNLPYLKRRMEELKDQRPDLAALVSYWKDTKGNEQHLYSLLRGHRMKLLLRRMLDPNEFLSEYGIRSVSKVYQEHPYDYWLDGVNYSVEYTPAESNSDLFGGNSNWRGPIWMPINYLLVQSLYSFHDYYTDDFKVEYPTHSGNYFSLAEIADSLGKRLKSIFLKNEKGERPVFGGQSKFNQDPHFKDYILFCEYFHGDNGKGLGATHQTGWTGLIAVLNG